MTLPPIPGERRRGRPPVALDLGAVLGLMADGWSDRAIARELGVSVRTIRRRLAEHDRDRAAKTAG